MGFTKLGVGGHGGASDPQARRVLEKWGEEDSLILPGLPRGRGWVWGAQRV